jgi:hypothetical protein
MNLLHEISVYNQKKIAFQWFGLILFLVSCAGSVFYTQYLKLGVFSSITITILVLSTILFLLKRGGKMLDNAIAGGILRKAKNASNIT